MTGPEPGHGRLKRLLVEVGCALILAAIGVFALDGAQHGGRRLQIARLTCIDLATQTEVLLRDTTALGRLIIDFSGLPGAVERLQPLLSAAVHDQSALWRIVMMDRTGDIMLDTRPSSPAPMLANGRSLVAVAADDRAPPMDPAWSRPDAELVRARFAAGRPHRIGISVRSDAADAAGRVVYLFIHSRDLPHPDGGIGRILLIGDDGVVMAGLGEEGELEANAAMAQGWRALPAQSRRSDVAVLAMADGDHLLVSHHLAHWPAAVLIDTGPPRLFWMRPPMAIALGLILAGTLSLLAGSGLIGRLRARGGRRTAAPETVGSLEREITQRSLSAGVAHEINNVLTILLLDAEMVAAAHPDDVELAMLSRSMLAASASAGALSQALLAYGERAVLRPRQIDLAATLRGQQPRLAEALFHGQRLICTGLDHGEIMLFLDPEALETCLLALLRNAAEASGPHTDIRVELKQVADNGWPTAILTVDDQGQGMSADERARALEPGFSTRSGGHHLGLGLSAAAGFAHQSGGRLSFESKPSLGTRVSLMLPVGGGPVGASRPLPTALLQRPAGRRWPAVRALPVVVDQRKPARVLLVDDSDGVRDSIARLLRADGYEVLEARNAAEAEVLVAEGVDVLVTDIVLGAGADGYTLAVRARAILPGLPLVFMSGYMSARNPGLLTGDDLANFVRKPVNGTELQTVLVGLLALRDSWPPGDIRTLAAEVLPDLT